MSKVIIRPMNIKTDALAIVDGAHEFVRYAGISHLCPENEDDFIDAVGRIITLEGAEVLVAEDEGEIIGGFGVLYAPYAWNPSVTVAEELFFDVFKGANSRAWGMLLDEVLKRVDEKGAIPMFKTLESGTKGLARLYSRRGLMPIETTHARY